MKPALVQATSRGIYPLRLVDRELSVTLPSTSFTSIDCGKHGLTRERERENPVWEENNAGMLRIVEESFRG